MSYPTFNDNPEEWGLKPHVWKSQAEADAAESLEIWGPEGPYKSYAEFIADGREE